MELSSPPRKKYKQACRNCRRKKARCPGERPVCSFCSRLKQPCEYDEPCMAHENIRGSVGDNKSNTRITEHGDELDVQPQTNEVERSVAARLANHVAKAAENRHNEGQERYTIDGARQILSFCTQSDEHLPQHLIVAAINTYFALFHNQPCTFFHEANFREKLHGGTVPSFLALSIVATTARLSTDAWFRGQQAEIGQHLADKAWKTILTTVLRFEETITVAAVQSLGLLALFDFWNGSYRQATTKLRIAISTAHVLQLGREPKMTFRPAEQEERRCLMWTLYVIDKLSALTYSHAVILGDQECEMRLPEDEELFRQNSQNNMGRLKASINNYSSEKVSPFAQMVCAASILGKMVMLATGGLMDSPGGDGSTSIYDMLCEQIRFCEQLFTRLDSINPVREALDSSRPNVLQRTRQNTQARFARAILHMGQVFLHHPISVRRWFSKTGEPLLAWRLHQALRECRKSALMLTEHVTKHVQEGAENGCILLPGFPIYIIGFTHLLFAQSSDTKIKQTSREGLSLMVTMLQQRRPTRGQSFVPAFLFALNHFSWHPGVAAQLVNPDKLVIHKAGNYPTALWRFLDFDWITDQLNPNVEPAGAGASTATTFHPCMSSIGTQMSISPTSSLSRSPSTSNTPLPKPTHSDDHWRKMQDLAFQASTRRSSIPEDKTGSKRSVKPIPSNNQEHLIFGDYHPNLFEAAAGEAEAGQRPHQEYAGSIPSLQTSPFRVEQPMTSNPPDQFQQHVFDPGWSLSPHNAPVSQAAQYGHILAQQSMYASNALEVEPYLRLIGRE